MTVCFYSDQMGNKGAFITLGKDLVPHFTSFEAVVRETTGVCRLKYPQGVMVWLCGLLIVYYAEYRF